MKAVDLAATAWLTILSASSIVPARSTACAGLARRFAFAELPLAPPREFSSFLWLGTWSNRRIDCETDAIIQRVISGYLQVRTVIMISHRLKSVMDLDRVLMLDSGRLIDDGSPKALLSDAGPASKALCDATRTQV